MLRIEISRHTQTGFQELHITPLRSTFLAHLIVGALVSKSLACSARRPHTIASQLPSPTQHTSDSLGLIRNIVLLAFMFVWRLPGIIRIGLLGQVVEEAIIGRLRAR